MAGLSFEVVHYMAELTNAKTAFAITVTFRPLVLIVNVFADVKTTVPSAESIGNFLSGTASMSAAVMNG